MMEGRRNGWEVEDDIYVTDSAARPEWLLVGEIQCAMRSPCGDERGTAGAMHAMHVRIWNWQDANILTGL